MEGEARSEFASLELCGENKAGIRGEKRLILWEGVGVVGGRGEGGGERRREGGRRGAHGVGGGRDRGGNKRRGRRRKR